MNESRLRPTTTRSSVSPSSRPFFNDQTVSSKREITGSPGISPAVDNRPSVRPSSERRHVTPCRRKRRSDAFFGVTFARVTYNTFVERGTITCAREGRRVQGQCDVSGHAPGYSVTRSSCNCKKWKQTSRPHVPSVVRYCCRVPHTCPTRPSLDDTLVRL